MPTSDPSHVSSSDRLAGRVAIVTGGGTSSPEPFGLGIGRAVAQLFARAGAHVVVVDRDGPAAERTCAAIAGDGGTSVAFVADVTEPESCRAATAAAVERWGRVDILVNNVGVTNAGGVAELAADEWRRVLDTNLTSAYSMSHHVVPVMLEAGGGTIVNVSSIAAVRGFGMAAYAASKGGLEALTTDTAAEYGDRGIRANCIAPGHVLTPMASPNGPDQRTDALKRVSAPLGTSGTAWHVAQVALFLASDDSAWVTGARIPVDAGLTAIAPMKVFGRMTAEAAHFPAG